LYSIHDDPEEKTTKPSPGVLPNNKSTKTGSSSTSKSGSSTPSIEPQELPEWAKVPLAGDDDLVMSQGHSSSEEEADEEFQSGREHDDDMNDDSSAGSEDEDDDDDELHDLERFGNAPVILPRGQYRGHANVETVKDGT
jgi:hypothetical protein